MQLHRRSPSPLPGTHSLQAPPHVQTSMMSMHLPSPGMVEMLRIDTGEASRDSKLEKLLKTEEDDDDNDEQNEVGSNCCGCDTKNPSDSYNAIFYVNVAAVAVHLIMLLVSGSMVGSRTSRLYNLKMDRVQVVPVPAQESPLFQNLPLLRQKTAMLSGGLYNHSGELSLAERQLKQNTHEVLKTFIDKMATFTSSQYGDFDSRLQNLACKLPREQLAPLWADINTNYSYRALVIQTFNSVCNSSLGVSNLALENTNNLKTRFVNEIDAAKQLIDGKIQNLTKAADKNLADGIAKAYESTVQTSFLQLRSPYTADWRSWHDKNTEPLSESCKLAQPNTLEFAGTLITDINLNMWVYPKASHVQLNIGFMVVGFFGLSALFQLPYAIFYWEQVVDTPFRYFSYRYIFGGSYDEKSYKKYKANYPTLFKFEKVCRKEIRFNWLRFVEYSISGSLMLIIVALTAGIIDIELIACMFSMSAACMLLGIVAEALWRARNVLIFVRNLLVVSTQGGGKGGKSSLLFEEDKYNRDLSKDDGIIEKIMQSRPELKQEEGDRGAVAGHRTISKTLDRLEGLFADYLKKTTIDEEKVFWEKKLQDVQTIRSNAEELKNTLKTTQQQVLKDVTKKIIVKWINGLAQTMLMGFWLTHLLAWVCIAVPWAIIWQHFVSYWDPCGARSLSTADIMKIIPNSTAVDERFNRKWAPPDFVLAVIWIELILFLAFGMVQAIAPLISIQQVFGARDTYALKINGTNNVNRSTELTYVILSLLAKFILGCILLANVIV